MNSSRPTLRAALVAVFYVLLACFGLYQLLFHLPNAVPGSSVTDYYHVHWGYWWVRYAFTHTNTNLYLTNFIFAPQTSNLAFHTLALTWYPIWALIEPLAGTTVAMTGVYIVALSLNGWVSFLFLRHLKIRFGLALLGGTIIELSPLLWMAVFWSNVNLMGWFWLLLIPLCWDKLAQTEGYRRTLWAALIAVALWGMVLTDLQYIVFALFIPAPIIALGFLRLEHVRQGRVFWASASALLGGFALLWFLGPIPYLLSYDRSGLSPTPAEHAVAVPFPDGWWRIYPDYAHIGFGWLILPLLLVVVIFAWRRRTAYWFWFALTPLPLVLTIGAHLPVGAQQIPLPYALLHAALGGMFRYPERFSILFLIPAVIFICLNLNTLTRKPRRLLQYSLFGLAFASSPLFLSVPTRPPPRPYAFYSAMAQEPYDYVVVEVPTGGSSGEGIVGEREYSELEFYGLTHGKRMVNGHIARVNTYNYWYMRTDDPMLSWLGQRRFLEASTVEQQMRERISAWPIGYFVIHTDLIGADKPATREILSFFNSHPELVCPLWVEGAAVVYRTVWHPLGCPPTNPPQVTPNVYRVDIGAADDQRYIGTGWYWTDQLTAETNWRWMGDTAQTTLYFDLPAGEYQLRFAAQAYWQTRHLQVSINGAALEGEFVVQPDGLQVLTAETPFNLSQQRVELTFTYDGWVVPKDVGQSEDTRRLAVSVDWLEFTRLTP